MHVQAPPTVTWDCGAMISSPVSVPWTLPESGRVSEPTVSWTVPSKVSPGAMALET